MRWDIDRKGHAGSSLAAAVLINTLHAAMRLIERNGSDRHNFTAPAPQSGGIATAIDPSSVGGASPTSRGSGVKPLWLAISPHGWQSHPSGPARDNHKAQARVP